MSVVWCGYRTRFIPQADAAELVNLYHLALVPLSAESFSTVGARKLAQRQWAAKMYAKEHPGTSVTGAYKDLDGLLA